MTEVLLFKGEQYPVYDLFKKFEKGDYPIAKVPEETLERWERVIKEWEAVQQEMEVAYNGESKEL